MPAVPIAEVVAEIMPPGAFVLSGDARTRISWARSVTIATLENATADDLILLDAGSLNNDNRAGRSLTRAISQLVAAHVQAIVIQGDVSIAALETAAQNRMVVVYLPEGIALEQVERAICRYIIDLQSQLEKQDATLQQDLARASNASFSIESILKLLAQRLLLPVVLHDAQLYRRAFALPERSDEAEQINEPGWKQQWDLLHDSQLVAHFAQDTSLHYSNASIVESPQSVSSAISVDNDVVGYISVLKSSGGVVDEFMTLALSRGAVVLGLILSKGNMSRNDRYTRGDWISDWIDGPPTDDPIISARAEQHGYLPDQVYVISTLRWVPKDDARRTAKVVKPEQVTEQARQEASQRRISAIIGQYRERTILFLPLEKAQHTGRMRQYMTNIAERLSEVFSGAIMCGVGRPAVGLTELRTSFHEAEQAMKLSNQLNDETSTQFFGDLSLIRLLLNVNSYGEIYQFCRDWLSDILDYDSQNNSDLLLTMSVYFDNNGNMAATAKQLNVHRNTLVYRLNRIAEITQLDMDDADVQLNLHLAIKAYKLLEKLSLI